MAMSDEHKAALAAGRRESRAVKSYLEALSARRPGRPVTKESVQKKIQGLEAKLSAEGDALRRLELTQAKLDAEEQLESMGDERDMSELEREFVAVAKTYSDRKGISYAAWREVGVAAATLKEAGIPRTRRS
jgi:hypothetical protein